MLFRSDAENASMPTDKVNIYESFPKPYFYSALIAYVLGLGTTLFVMMQFQAAQPALLYLVPACLGSSFLCAVLRGEVSTLLSYSEEVPDEDDPPSEEESKKEEDKKND